MQVLGGFLLNKWYICKSVLYNVWFVERHNKLWATILYIHLTLPLCGFWHCYSIINGFCFPFVEIFMKKGNCTPHTKEWFLFKILSTAIDLVEWNRDWRMTKRIYYLLIKNRKFRWSWVMLSAAYLFVKKSVFYLILEIARWHMIAILYCYKLSVIHHIY